MRIAKCFSTFFHIEKQKTTIIIIIGGNNHYYHLEMEKWNRISLAQMEQTSKKNVLSISS